MYRKHNPMLSLVALVLLALILVLACTGCTEAEATGIETAPRFTETIETLTYGYVHIITDTKTGAQYMYYRAGQGGGLCKLEG